MELDSDFRQHAIGVPQIAPAPNDPTAGNVTFDGPGQNEDFGLEQILRGPLGPMAPVLGRLDPLVSTPIHLTDEEFQQLSDFVKNGLLDPRAKPSNLRKLVPKTVPSGRPTLTFEFDQLDR